MAFEGLNVIVLLPGDHHFPSNHDFANESTGFYSLGGPRCHYFRAWEMCLQVTINW